MHSTVVYSSFPSPPPQAPPCPWPWNAPSASGLPILLLSANLVWCECVCVCVCVCMWLTTFQSCSILAMLFIFKQKNCKGREFSVPTGKETLIRQALAAPWLNEEEPWWSWSVPAREGLRPKSEKRELPLLVSNNRQHKADEIQEQGEPGGKYRTKGPSHTFVTPGITVAKGLWA